MERYIIIAVVCAIYAGIMSPINRVLDKRIKSRLGAFAASVGVGAIILVVLYLLAALLGFNAFK